MFMDLIEVVIFIVEVLRPAANWTQLTRELFYDACIAIERRMLYPRGTRCERDTVFVGY